MVVTQRDRKVLDLVEQFKVVDVERVYKTISDFPNKYIVRRRLKELYRAKHLKKARHFIGESYIYYKKPVKQIEHRFLLLDFYSLLSKMCKILFFETEYKLKGIPGIRKKGDVIADAYTKVERSDGLRATFAIEVQQPFNPMNFEKYKSLDAPTIILITDKHIEKPKDLDVIIIKTDFSNIKEVLQ